jgi:hypothetical protein
LTLFIRQAAVIVARPTLIAGLLLIALRALHRRPAGLIAGLLLIALRVPLAANAAGGAPTASSPG